MATYRFPRMLTLLAWEEELRHGSYEVEAAWSQPTPADDLHLDFSRVEFADFGALARALLLLDTAARSGIPATVTLPTASFAASEQTGARPTLAARRARARGDALAFMRQVGFLGSLRAPHWDVDAVRVRHRATAGARESRAVTGKPDPDPHNAPYRRQRVFPFRWLEPMPAAQLRESDSFLAVSAGLEDLGLSRSDARTLSQTVLTELVENVAEHGSVGDRPAVALVGAIRLSAETYMLRQNGMHAHMAEVAERALADGSHVLRLIVADSGADLFARLAPTHGQRGIAGGTVTASRREETVLSALGDPSAVTAADVSARRGTTGLWWVARVVRSYRGGVQARTADLLAGVLFGRTADGTGVTELGFGHVPGTLLELTLPTGPHPPRRHMLWGSQQTSGAAPDLQWVNCVFDPRRGLSDADRARLVAQVRTAQPARQATGLVVTISVHDPGDGRVDDRWRGAMGQVLEFMCSIARSVTVVAVFPDAEPHMLDPCVGAFNQELAASGDDAHGPMLVLGCHGDPVWCGGTPPLRAVLNSLSGDEGSVSTAEARERWRMAGGEPALFSAAMRANEHLLSSGRRRPQLRLSPSAVHGTIEPAVNRRLAEAIAGGGEGVELGMFRGPTLRVTNRWIDIEQLLAGTVGVQLAAFVLARKVEVALRVSAQQGAPTEIVQVGSTPRLLARHLSECLTLGGRCYPQPSELDIGEPPAGERVPAGAKVVLCADLISTENTVRRAAATVAGGDAHPLVIACVVDARDTRGPVRLLNRIIPVVSLTEVRISLRDASAPTVTDIDPLMLRPEASALAQSAKAEEPVLPLWLSSDPDVLRLGHIEDPPHRHYSAFIRLQALRRQGTREQVRDAVLSSMNRAFAEIRSYAGLEPATESPVAIWYVAQDGNAGSLADIVRDSLAAEGAEISGVTPIPRLSAGYKWAFPPSLSKVNGPMGVVIIHWWAITGSTLQHLVRLAAKSGASWVVAVCMLNQLDADDADAVRMMRAVSDPTADADTDDARSASDLRTAPLIPVAIRFDAPSSITALDAHDCPMCATRDRYQLGDDAAPARLVRHAELLRDMLRPRELEEVSRDSAADLFTVPVTSEEAIDYLRWRRLLSRARRGVRGRQEVIDRLRVLIGDAGSGEQLGLNAESEEWTSVGLIRLLAAEQQWLRLPPLHLEDAKDLLADVCVSSLGQLTAPPWLRVQALMVMSAAIPQRLVELLPRLLTLVGHEAVLADQLLLDCWRLLLRPPGDSPIDVEQLRHNLMDCRDYLEEQRAKPDAAAADDHLHVVRDLITIADYRILRKPKDAQVAWERLREDLARPVVRHRLEAELLLVRGFVEDIETVEPSPELARTAGAYWDTCARQLEQRALANLPALRDILAGDFVSDWLGRRDQHRLLTLARADVGELRAVTDRLYLLTHGARRPADPSWQLLRRELLDRINWWNRVFLAAHIPDHDVPALLVELIHSVPAKLGPSVVRVLGVHQAHATIAGSEAGDVNVFCPEKLLDQIVAHLLENVRKHSLSDARCRLHVEYMRDADKAVQLVMRNSGTRPSVSPGHGLKALNDKLRPFGGKLTGHVLAEDNWTFAAVATLPLWHGG